ncbi:MAG TPA: glycoside hydrolase family 2 TIM barrel-domain containing protein [Verrucomicrobiae bacterium]|nr:glycoside hydrolase family 2 TIM barrel-domain containing protein [Verrucomicrobiae bacterium]
MPRAIETQSKDRVCARAVLATTALLVSLAVASTTLLPLRALADEPVRVEVVKTGSGWHLARDGKPYFIKGVGGTGSKALLVQLGGNSFRTWGADRLTDDLADAQNLGLTVTAGIWLGHRRQGFDYHNADQVAAQLDKTRAIVRHFRNSPALLIWAIGNEMENDEPADDPAVWHAIEDIAAMIKQEDPNHPTMTVIAEVGNDKIPNLHRYCPHIDIVGINSYAGGESVGDRYRNAGGIKPYIITEFGPPGQWEMEKKPWGGVRELTSTEKADWYRRTYVHSVTGQPGLCLGSYAFNWGFKREATATWYGMFLPDGSKVAAVDTISELWTGKPVTNPCPKINSLKLAQGSGEYPTGAVVRAVLDTSSASGEPVTVTWELRRDAFQYQADAEGASGASGFPEAITRSRDNEVVLKMPNAGGGYRLYAYVRTPHNGSATANLSLYVDAPAPRPAPTKLQ